MSPRVAVLTVSSSRAAGEATDEGGPALARWAREQLGATDVSVELVADDRERIAARLRELAEDGAELLLTTGGTGLAPDDLTPEATREVIEREAPGIAEAMRLTSREHTPHWMLSRAVCGTRGSTLIVNFPGSPKAIAEAGAAIAAALPHALALLGGGRPAHGPTD